MNDITKRTQTVKVNAPQQWATYYEIKNAHMGEIKRLKRQNLFLGYFIAGTVGASIALTFVLIHQIYFV